MKKIDMVGKVFGRLTVVAESNTWASGRRLVDCQCSCGVTVARRRVCLVSGTTTSCGCYQKEQLAERNRTHGGTNTPEYKSWAGMLQRCNNPNHHAYANYGGRGIKVDWGTFEQFLQDMGDKPSPKHSIDRVDVNGNYSKNNCRWATDIEQNNNRRSNRPLTLHGVTRTTAEWAIEVSVASTTIRKRLQYGWSVEAALTTPLRRDLHAR